MMMLIAGISAVSAATITKHNDRWTECQWTVFFQRSCCQCYKWQSVRLCGLYCGKRHRHNKSSGVFPCSEFLMPLRKTRWQMNRKVRNRVLVAIFAEAWFSFVCMMVIRGA